MNGKIDRLYDLLPTVYKQRDDEQQLPLKALLRVITGQVNVVEQDIAHLYDNWFIETCDDWVVPYIADLVGYEPVHEAGEPGEVTNGRGLQRNKILIPRSEVANTIRNRRRKGTLALLELLAFDVAKWPARAVEYFPLVSFTQSLNHLRFGQPSFKTVDLRNGDALGRLDGPFDEIAHTVDVRRPNSRHAPGRYNIPSVVLFLWRLKAYRIQKSIAYNMESEGTNFFTFSVLGNDMPLFTRSVPEELPTQIAGELNLPAPIRRKALQENLEALYGENKSLQMWKDGEKVAADKIVAANLSDWFYKPDEGFIAVDPVLGRIALHPTELPEEGIHVTYHYGFSENLGGGEYFRPLMQPTLHNLGDFELCEQDVSEFKTLIEKLQARETLCLQDIYGKLSPGLQGKVDRYESGKRIFQSLKNELIDGLNAIVHGESIDEALLNEDDIPPQIKALIEMQPQGAKLLYLNRVLLEICFGSELINILKIYRIGPDEEITSINKALERMDRDNPRHAIFELIGNEVFVEQLEFKLKKDQTLQIRAQNQQRPVIRLLDFKTGLPDALEVEGEENSRFTLDGILVTGRGVTVKGKLDELNIRHCTLVPGWTIDHECRPFREAGKSIVLFNTETRVSISHSIVGSIEVLQKDVVKFDPNLISISDSILDATRFDLEALSDPDCSAAFAILNIQRTTVIGKIFVHAIELGENCLFTSDVHVARRQIGCVRFSFVTPDSRTPKRFNCQPDLVEQRAKARGTPELVESEQARVIPQFNSVRYGTPAYCQLTGRTAEEIKRGADDESEMGAFHDLFQPQREANIRTRLQEYTPAGMNAGIVFAN